MKTMPRIFAMARGGVLPLPANFNNVAMTSPQAFDRWAEGPSAFRPVAEKTDNVIQMFDVIGEDFWTGGGITAKSVSRALAEIGDQPVEVQINSPGGDMFAGIAIYNILREHKAGVTVKVMGLAASAASIIAMAGDEIQIGAAGFLMIHNCWVLVIANRHDMRTIADQLETFDTAMADVYAARSNLSAEEAGKMMDAETWLSGSKAIEHGLADALLPADQVREDEVAKADAGSTSQLYAMEYALIKSGQAKSRADARTQMKAFFQSKPGAALPPMPGAGNEDDELVAAITAATKTLNSMKGI